MRKTGDSRHGRHQQRKLGDRHFLADFRGEPADPFLVSLLMRTRRGVSLVQADIKRRALAALQAHMRGEALGDGIEAPLWALVDVSHGSEAVKSACLWFKAALGYPDDDETRLMLCREAYAKIERALRCYL